MGLINIAKYVGKGINDVAKSLNTPNSSRRMKIGNLPSSRSEIPIASNWNASAKNLRDPRFGSRDFGSRNLNRK